MATAKKTATKTATKKKATANTDSDKSLLIVESPAKAKTIEKFLDNKFIVRSCYGHIRDLPKNDKAIDVENGFEPKYEVSADKKEVVKELIQDQLTPENIVRELRIILNDAERKRQLHQDYLELRNLLRKGGAASANAAKSIYTFLHQGSAISSTVS